MCLFQPILKCHQLFAFSSHANLLKCISLSLLSLQLPAFPILRKILILLQLLHLFQLLFLQQFLFQFFCSLFFTFFPTRSFLPLLFNPLHFSFFQNILSCQLIQIFLRKTFLDQFKQKIYEQTYQNSSKITLVNVNQTGTMDNRN